MARNQQHFLTPEEIAVASPQELAQAFMPLARNMAAKARPNCEDTEGDAFVGLVKASQHYDPNKGPFYPYAMLWIRQAITRGTSGQRHSVWLPQSVRARLALVLGARTRIGDNATAEAIALDLGEPWTAAEVERLLSTPRAIAADSADNGDDNRPTNDAVFVDRAAEVEFETAESRADLTEILKELPDDLALAACAWIDDHRNRAVLTRIARSIRAQIEGDALL